MKLAFLILVLLNLALFAWQQGAFGRFAESGREPERVARQIEAERFRVLNEQEVQKLKERASQSKGEPTIGQ
ncbi:MAG: sporulation protein [Burkholderiaceae bacterium]